jgi:CRISPR/Cas system-associated exonuclease Cas4 (RecB family)
LTILFPDCSLDEWVQQEDCRKDGAHKKRAVEALLSNKYLGSIMSSTHFDFKTLTRRPQPYVHPSWLAKNVSGDRQCLLASYLQANFKIPPKPGNDFDSEGYKLKHQQTLVSYIGALHSDGYTVHAEKENSFWYKTKSGATISAQPDIVAMRDNEPMIVDIKTGKPKATDIAQVKLYMAMLPSSNLHGISAIPNGRLVYGVDEFEIEASEVTSEFKRQVAQIMGALTTSDMPDPTPSLCECRYCPVSHVCPYKTEQVAEGTDDWL